MSPYRCRVRPAVEPVAALAAACLLCAAGPAMAQVTATTTRPLDFGRFVAGSGGTVTVAPSGMRSATGGVVLLGSPTAGAAGFMLTQPMQNASSQAVVITLPPDGSVRLSSGARSMAVNLFVSAPAVILTLPTGGQTLSVGATMTVAPNQAGGNYAGSFPLIVNFE